MRKNQNMLLWCKKIHGECTAEGDVQLFYPIAMLSVQCVQCECSQSLSA